jgi:hypothetical protein
MKMIMRGLAMQTIDEIHQKVETDIDTYTETLLPPLQHQWPLPPHELFALKLAFPAPQEPQTETDQRERRKAIRQAIIRQLNSNEATIARDLAYLAFFLVKKGRGGEIVGNPYAIKTNGKSNHQQQELPYTGLEGYYAGSEKTATRPGLALEEIILEEAKIGAELLKTVKKHYIEHNAWVDFAHLKQMLDEGRSDPYELKTLQVYFGMVVGRLHVRIYHNSEFALTPSEQIEQLGQLLSEVSGRTSEDQHLRRDLQATYEKLRHERENMSEAERKQEQQERRRREQVRAERLAEFHNFRAETYHILAASSQGSYTVGVQDTTPDNVVITETVTLPDIPSRNSYPPTYVRMTAEQVEGYLFLTKLGELGGDPIVRSVYR